MAKKFLKAPILSFGEPPPAPFFSCSIRTNRIFESPLRPLVHDKNGLYVSFHGTLAFSLHVDLHTAPPSLFEDCWTPCKTTCPVIAFNDGFYNANRYKLHLSGTYKPNFLSQGCATRGICLINKRMRRITGQSASHMKAFNK